ncbi:chemotaxis protein CheX [Aurantivibrio plasticivorans]
MNVNYVNPLLEATVNVLSTMAFLDVDAGKPSIASAKSFAGDVTGFINFEGQPVAGWLAVSFPRETIFTIVKNMLGDDVDEITPQVMDCVGEITNMISGGAKRLYAEQGLDIGLLRPQVMLGQHYPESALCEGVPIELPFKTGNGTLSVQFHFH